MDEKEKLKIVFSNNLKRELKIHGKNQADLCEVLNLTSSTVSDWVNAKKYPRMDKVQLIADYLGILKSDLTEEQHEINKKSRGIRIPVLGKVIAGIPIEAVEEIIDYEEISEQMGRTGDFFALQIKGDSMEPQMSEGDIVVVKKQSDLDSGQIGIVLVNGDEATVKKVIKKENGIMLVPFNQEKYEPWFYDKYDIETKPVTLIGRVVELRKKY